MKSLHTAFSHEHLLKLAEDHVAAYPGNMAAVLVDVADVSRLQARLGFIQGEERLAALARAILEAFTDRGRICRLGDGRFLVLLPHLRNLGHSRLAAEKLLRVTEDVFAQGSGHIAPQLSVGIALYPQQASTVAQLLYYAQLAATSARQNAERIRAYDEQAAELMLRPWNLGTAYAEALTTGGLSVFYQPKINIADGSVAGTEALLRWPGDKGPVATPDVFIPLAEESGRMHATTWYVLTNALRESAAQGLPVAVNISPAMLHEREFLEMIRSAIDSWHVPEGYLTIEVTEGAVISDFELSAARLRKVRDMGVRVSLDDFGTGYSALSYFKKIPVDELKIDKSFVMGMRDDADDQQIVRTVLALAKHFKLKTVAEGVEDVTALGLLRDMGCDYAQGFYFSKALPPAELTAWRQQREQSLVTA